MTIIILLKKHNMGIMQILRWAKLQKNLFFMDRKGTQKR